MNRNIKIILSLILLFVFCDSIYSQVSEDSLQSIIKLDLKQKSNIDTNNFNIFPKQYNKKKIALVLSGGGARGISQIGVLKSLEIHNIQFDMIVGTSIGAIVGGLYASGYTADELDSITRTIDWQSKLSLSNKNEREFLYLEQKKAQDKGLISFSIDGLKPVFPTSLSSGYQIAQTFNVLLLNARFRPKKDFSSLRYPFSAVATDLDNGKKIVLKNGNISECIKASFTFPLLYSPTIINGRNLVDGGLTANIPVDVAKEQGADIVIAVNSTSPLKSTEELKDPFNTADQILSITMAQINDKQLADADIIITPKIGNTLASDFSNINYLVKKGEMETENYIDRIKELVDSIELSASQNKGYFLTNPKVNINSKLIPDSIKATVKASQENTFVKYTTIEKQLKQFYDIGYFNNVFAVIKRDSFGLNLDYNFIENPKLNEIKLNNSDNILYEHIKNFEYENKGEVINHNNLYNLYFDLLGIIKSNNLCVSDIQKFYFDYVSGNLLIDVSDGTIEDILICGNKKTKDNVILRELSFEGKKVIRKIDIEQSLQNIYSTNLFQQLSFNLIDSEYTNRPSLSIQLIEKSSRNLRFSMRADNERKLQLYFELNNESIFGTNNEVALSLNGGLKDGEYKTEFKSNRFFNTYFTYNLSFYYKFIDISSYAQIKNFNDNSYSRSLLGEYRDTRYGGSFLLGSQVGRIGTVYGQLSYEKLTRDLLQGDVPTESDFRTIKLKFGGKIDTQDKYPFPTKGSIINYYYETSQKIIAENVSYSKFLFDFEHSITFGKINTIRPKFVFGFADKTTPLMEHFSLGGENSFFGMMENELRGRQILSTSLEYRILLPYKLFFDTYLSARYDLGQIWDNAEDIRFKDLRHGIGLSALFNTPIGKASFSVGRSFLINKGLTQESFMFGPYTFYFSIGYDL
ncbi:MAG: patatin-like phospholipase family protein [Ignavibacteria bacterium]|jgi:NTE family protein